MSAKKAAKNPVSAESQPKPPETLSKEQTPFTAFVDGARGVVGYGRTYGEHSYNGRPIVAGFGTVNLRPIAIARNIRNLSAIRIDLGETCTVPTTASSQELGDQLRALNHALAQAEKGEVG